MLGLFLWNCSGDVDTSRFTAEEYFEYALSSYNEEDYEVALREFESILLQYPGSTVSDDAKFYLGMTYFHREEYILAAYEFSKLISDIPASPFVPESQYMLAESYYQLSPVYQLDQQYTKKAIEEFQAFIDFFPTDEKVSEAEKKIKEMNAKLAEKEYNSAYIYEKMEYYNAAIKYYDYVAQTYHDTEIAPEALYRKIKVLFEKERITEALTDIAIFLQRYPNNSKAQELQKLEAEFTQNF